MSIPTQPPINAEADQIPIAADDEHVPYVASSKDLAELTPGAIVLGILLGLVFALSSVYLALKVGLTVSASIPISVLSITIFRYISKSFGAKPATILQNNMVQTTGSAGESVAAGIVFTLPALLAARLQSAVDEGCRCRARGRTARRVSHDPAAQRIDREGAQDPQVSRGNGGCRGADRRRGARRAGAHGVSRLRARARCTSFS